MLKPQTMLKLKSLIFCSSDMSLQKYLNNAYRGAVVVAQLVEQLLPIPELCSLNPVIGKNFIEHLFSVNSSEKKEIKKKNPGMAH